MPWLLIKFLGLESQAAYSRCALVQSCVLIFLFLYFQQVVCKLIFQQNIESLFLIKNKNSVSCSGGGGVVGGGGCLFEAPPNMMGTYTREELI